MLVSGLCLGNNGDTQLQVLHLYFGFLGDSQQQLLHTKLFQLRSLSDCISEGTPRLLMKEWKWNCLCLRSYPSHHQARANPHHAGLGKPAEELVVKQLLYNLVPDKQGKNGLDWLRRWVATLTFGKEYLSHTVTTELLNGNHISEAKFQMKSGLDDIICVETWFGLILKLIITPQGNSHFHRSSIRTSLCCSLFTFTSSHFHCNLPLICWLHLSPKASLLFYILNLKLHREIDRPISISEASQSIEAHLSWGNTFTVDVCVHF